MHTSRFCDRCGTRVDDAGELKGLCAACLLEAGRDAPTRAFEEEDEPTLADVRRWFPQLEVEARIGRGGMGVVYRARQPRLDRTVALKVLAPELSRDPRFAERFEREARAMARLSHPAIVSVYDFGEVDGRFFLLMEHVDGTTVRELMRTGITPAQALALVPAICEGLQYAHDAGVVHRDIKPENVLVDRSGAPRIADFGLAKLTGRSGGATLTGSNQVMGSLHYMAPEQMRDPQAVDHRADIYSLGVMLYEMLTRELPVGTFPPPSRLAPVDARLDEVVARALQHEPSRRYQSARDVKTDVEGEAARVPPAAASASVEATWIDAFPGGATGASLVALVVGIAATAVVAGPARHGRTEWFALVWPFAFLPLVAVRSRALDRPRRVALALLGTAASAAVAYALSWTPDHVGFGRVAGVTSCLLFVAAAVQFDRWARGASVARFGLAAGLMIASTIVHSALAWNPGREAYYHASGMTAVAAGAGTAAILCVDLATRAHDRRVVASVLRALAVGVAAAAFYFHRHVF